MLYDGAMTREEAQKKSEDISRSKVPSYIH